MQKLFPTKIEEDTTKKLQQPYEGGFWYEGIYYKSQNAFYKQNGYHYTYKMYYENYPMWGEGQKPT